MGRGKKKGGGLIDSIIFGNSGRRGDHGIKRKHGGKRGGGPGKNAKHGKGKRDNHHSQNPKGNRG